MIIKLLRKLLSLTLVITTTAACSQLKSNKKYVMETNAKDQNELEVINVARQLTRLMIDKDTTGLNAILDKHFTLTHITGYVQPKSEWYTEIETERMKYYSYKEVKTQVKIDGDNAIVVGQNILDARIWGSRNNWHLQQTMQLKKRNEKWIILNSVATTF
jgi:hypothetical protein